MIRITVAALLALLFCIPALPVAATQDAPMPLRGASLTLKVPDFALARTQLFAAASDAGAQITEGQTVVDAKGRRHGYLSLRLPADALPRLLPAIRTVGILASDKITTSDASAEYAGLEARITELRKHQSRLDTLLRSGRNLRGSDTLYIQERLFRSGVDEAGLVQERRNIENRSRVAQVTVTIFEPLPVARAVPAIRAVPMSWAHGYSNAVRRAEYRRGELVNRLLTLSAFIVVYAPLWVPAVGAVAFLLWHRRALLARAVRQLSAFVAALRPHTAKGDAVETGN